MGKITRAELDISLRTELDDIKGYIDATDALLLGQHVANRSNPHNVTKAQVGLGSISNNLQSDFETHANARNPHNTRASDVGAVNNTRLVTAGTGLSGGGALNTDRTLSLDRTYTDGRYLRRSGVSHTTSTAVRPFVFERTGENAGTAEIHRGYGGVGFSIDGGSPEFHVAPDGSVGINHYASSRNDRLYVNGSIRTTSGIIVGTTSPGSNLNNTGTSTTGALYRRSSDDSLRFMHSSGWETVYTSKKINYGTRNPSGGQNGDIYIQY